MVEKEDGGVFKPYCEPHGASRVEGGESGTVIL